MADLSIPCNLNIKLLHLAEFGPTAEELQYQISGKLSFTNMTEQPRTADSSGIIAADGIEFVEVSAGVIPRVSFQTADEIQLTIKTMLLGWINDARGKFEFDYEYVDEEFLRNIIGDQYDTLKPYAMRLTVTSTHARLEDARIKLMAIRDYMRNNKNSWARSKVSKNPFAGEDMKKILGLLQGSVFLLTYVHYLTSQKKDIQYPFEEYEKALGGMMWPWRFITHVKQHIERWRQIPWEKVEAECGNNEHCTIDTGEAAMKKAAKNLLLLGMHN